MRKKTPCANSFVPGANKINPGAENSIPETKKIQNPHEVNSARINLIDGGKLFYGDKFDIITYLNSGSI
jgi:hypothetical protein